MFSDRGFTLVELAIVLIVIGLVTGGILVGRDLIRTAGLRGDIAEFHRLDMAFNAFRVKYNCLAGDCVDASSYLSGATNGNGDGWISTAWTSYALCGQVGYAESESASAFDSLARASMIKMSPTPGLSPVSSNGVWQAGVDLLAIPSHPDWGVIVVVACASAGSDNMPIGHRYLVGGKGSSEAGSFETASPAYSTADAFYIDNKTDDGRPLTGAVISAEVTTYDDGFARATTNPTSSGACVSDAANNPYNLNEKKSLCALLVKPNF